MRLSKLSIALILLMVIGLMSIPKVYAQNNFLKDRCNSLGYEIATALNTSDYVSMKKISEWGVANCKSILPIRSYYEQYASLSIAKQNLGDDRGAMRDVNTCIKEKYDLVDCHVQKYSILMGTEKISIEKLDEAILERNISLKLIDLELDKIQKKYPPYNDYEYANSKRILLNAQKEYLNR